MHVILFLQFTLLKYINNVTSYVRFFSIEQLRHLVCCQPHGFLLEFNLQLCLPVLALIEYDGRVVARYYFVAKCVFHSDVYLLECMFVLQKYNFYIQATSILASARLAIDGNYWWLVLSSIYDFIVED